MNNTQNVRNVQLRRVRVSNVAVGKQEVLHNLNVCVCSLSYPTRTAHAPYCTAVCGLSCPALPYIFLSRYPKKGANFLKKN